MKKSVFVTRIIPQAGLDLLKERYAVTVFEKNEPVDQASLIKGVKNADGLICLLSDVIDNTVLKEARRLKIIANYAVGYNNIDMEAAENKGIMVTNTPDVLTNATAELAFALLTAATRHIVAADRYTRDGKFIGWDPMLFLGDESAGKQVGIIGMGRIGLSMAQKCLAFGMSVIYHNRRPLDDHVEKKWSVEYCSLNDLLGRADIISIHTPLTEQTYRLINKEAFDRIKPGAYLINTSRGEVVDEAALVDCLKSGKLKGAGLDVYEQEPHVHEALIKMDNVVLLPHIGSATTDARNKMSMMAAENVIAALEGKRPKNLIGETTNK